MSVGQTLAISPEQSHYLQNVMRLKAGDTLRVFNGSDGEWRATISGVSKRSVELTTHEQIRPQIIGRDIWLCCAPIKKAHFDTMIEKATELGVSAVQPILTSRTQIREVNVERCASIMTEASEQSERLDIPVCHAPITLAKFVETYPRDRSLIVCAELGDAQPLHSALASPALRDANKIAIITGPEGGFAVDELETLRELSQAIFVRLGPRILRADTAAIAALSCWQAFCGDWTSS